MRHHREKGWDYRGRAIYHFTLPVEGRYPLFGALEGESAETAFVRLNAFGRRVCQMLSGLAQFYRGKGYALKVLAQMVMPDHVHLVIQVLEPLPQSIGAVVRGFKSGCTKVYKEEFYHSGENAAEVHGEAQAAPAEALDFAPVHFARIFAGRGSIWQQDKAYYHERILHAPGQLRRMIDYVKDNPRRLWLKSHNPDLFRLHRRTMAAGLSFTSMGNHFLLNWPDGQTVEMSRSATNDQIQERLHSALAAAHNGAVTYTAAISKGEQIIARSLREQGYPLVVLLNDGFPKEPPPVSDTTNQVASISGHVQKDCYCYWSPPNRRSSMFLFKRRSKRPCAVRQKNGITAIRQYQQPLSVTALWPSTRWQS